MRKAVSTYLSLLNQIICLPILRPNPSKETSIKSSTDRERVVILGSGWAGFGLARKLDPTKFQTVIVSPRTYFAFTPLLASTAVGTLEFRTALEPIRSKHQRVDFFQGWGDDVDFKAKTITIEEAVDDPLQGLALTKDRHAGETLEQRTHRRVKEQKEGKLFTLPYDKLIITVGCYSQTFGTPGVREHAFFLKDVGDARKIRNRLLSCFEAAALPTTPDSVKRQLLKFAIVGGGPTGIEFGAELHDLIHEDLAKIYPELIPLHKIVVYDVASKVLPMFDEKLAEYAMSKFRREGIEIKTSHHVQELRPGAPCEATEPSQSKDNMNLYTLKIKEEGEIGVGMCVWSTGLMQNPFVAKALAGVKALPDHLELPPSARHAYKSQDTKWIIKKAPRSGSVITDDRLRVKVTTEDNPEERNDAKASGNDKHQGIIPDVFALGDCGIIDGTAYPATAQVAQQKAFWLARRLNKGDLHAHKFHFKDAGTLAYIGNWNALFQTGAGGRLQGYLAWIIWRGAYFTRTVSLRNKFLVPIYW